MKLPKELITEFAKLTAPKTIKTETTVYGTIVERNGSTYVRIDGSDELTPASTTVDMSSGERVLVRIKNHTATVVGNITSPAAKNSDLEKVATTMDSINYTSEGVVVADFKVEDVTYNILVNQNGVYIRKASTNLAKFDSDIVELGNANEIVNIYGKAIYHYIKGVAYKPYYSSGDSFNLEWHGAGYISNSSDTVYFSIPLSKPAVGEPNVSIRSSNGMKVCQNRGLTSNFTHGSSSSAYASPSSYSATLTEDGGMINIIATFSNTTNAVANAPCGIMASINITFS